MCLETGQVAGFLRIHVRAREDWIHLCQTSSFWSAEVKHQRQIDTSGAALREARQTRRLIADIDRIIQILDSDIAAEEKQSRIFDLSQAEYPMVARALAARRDNLRETIAALEERLVNAPIELLEPA
jgi:hypothetical protein